MNAVSRQLQSRKKNPTEDRATFKRNKDIQCYREKSGWFLNSSQIVGYMLCFVIRWDMQRETCWRQRNTANHYLCECVIVCMFDLVLCSICLLHWSCASILIVFGSTDWQKRIGLVGVCWHVGMLNGKQIKHFKNEKTRYFHWISTFAMTAIFWNVFFLQAFEFLEKIMKNYRLQKHSAMYWCFLSQYNVDKCIERHWKFDHDPNRKSIL